MKRSVRLVKLAIATAAILSTFAVSALPASAVSLASGSVVATTTGHDRTYSHTYDGLATSLNAYYNMNSYYGDSSTVRSDFRTVYTYNTTLGYKYADIVIGSTTYSSNGKDGQKSNYVSKLIDVNVPVTVVYTGYCKNSSSENKLYQMTYMLSVTKP